MEAVLKSIRDYFLDKEKYFIVFAKVDTRIEGWFKAELILFLNELQEKGCIENFKREAKNQSRAGRKKIDFHLWLNGERHLCELKALCISQNAGTPSNLNFYFKDDTVGIINDFKKLDSLPDEKNKWVVGFVYPKPTLQQWDYTIASIPKDLRHWQCITKPQDFPDFLFISVWKWTTSL